MSTEVGSLEVDDSEADVAVSDVVVTEFLVSCSVGGTAGTDVGRGISWLVFIVTDLSISMGHGGGVEAI